MEHFISTMYPDVSGKIPVNLHFWTNTRETAKNIAVFYDDKASYSIMESPYSPDHISQSPTAQKWEHISLFKKCEADNYIGWEVMYTFTSIRNRLSITHYDNGGVTIMPPKGKYVHVIGEKNANKTHLIVNTNSRKLCDVYGIDGTSWQGEYGFFALTDDWMRLSALTEGAIESYMYGCEYDIGKIILGNAADSAMPPLLFGDYTYSSFTRNACVSRTLQEFCEKNGLDLMQVCTRVDNDIDDEHWTETEIVIGHLDSTVFWLSDSGYVPHSNYLVWLNATKFDSSDKWSAWVYSEEGNELNGEMKNPVVSGCIDPVRRHSVMSLSVDPRIEELMIEEAKRRL